MFENRIIKHRDPKEAYQALKNDFNAWSMYISSYSLQTSYAIIVANWAVHKELDQIKNNCCSKWSIIIIISFLGLNLLLTLWMTCLLRKRGEYVEENAIRWKREFKETKVTFWPYTRFIECLGVHMRIFKTIVPIIAGVFFVCSLF